MWVTRTGEMATGDHETVRLTATIAGEMAVQDVPLANGVNLAALKAGDEDPLEVVVEVPAGHSKRGWNYTPAALQKIVGEVMTQGLPGFLGHQKPEDVSTQFPTPVTHWVGAKWQDGRAYFRGIVDKSAADLKRWIRGNTIRTVSIFGEPKLQQVSGETHVVDYRPLSIDWTPLGRAGMPTAVVALGEQDIITGQAPDKQGGGQIMTLQELLAKLRELGAQPGAVIGEMGWRPEDVARALSIKLEDIAPLLAGEQWTALQEAAKTVGEMAAVLGLDKAAKPADVLTAAKAMQEQATKAEAAAQAQLIDKIIGEMVQVETVRPVVKRLLRVAADADEASIKKAVGEMLEDAAVKPLLTGSYTQQPIHVVDTSHGSQQTTAPAGLRVRRTAI